MNEGVLVMVDGRMKVLHRVGGGDDEMLRTVLEHRPELVVGAATPGDRRRLLLVRHRAVGNGSSLERLYVDSDAVPVLVGVELATDGGAAGDALLRLLDRVAVELSRWRGGRLRELAGATHAELDEATLLARALDRRVDPDTFWAIAESHLAHHRLRVVLVADRHPDELLRVIELLDGHLRGIEVRAVEVALHGSGPVRALVPHAASTASSRRRAGDAALLALLDPAADVPAPGRHRLRD